MTAMLVTQPNPRHNPPAALNPQHSPESQASRLHRLHVEEASFSSQLYSISQKAAAGRWAELF